MNKELLPNYVSVQSYFTQDDHMLDFADSDWNQFVAFATDQEDELEFAFKDFIGEMYAEWLADRSEAVT